MKDTGEPPPQRPARSAGGAVARSERELSAPAPLGALRLARGARTWRTLSTPRRIAWCCVAVAAAVTIGLLLGSGIGTTDVSRDSRQVIAGTRTALGCIGRLVLVGCGRVPHTPLTQVGPFPLLQHIPAAFFIALGLPERTILRLLALLSLLCFCASLALVMAAGRRLPRPWWGPIFAVVLLTGPLSYYATSAFGEMLAATLALAAVVAALWRRPALTAALVLAAGLGKETMAPFVVVLALVAARDPGALLPSRRMLGAVFFGGAGSVLLTMAFNVFRFGDITNVAYLEPVFSVPLGVRVSFFVALLAGPQGGLAWFWPSSLMIVALLTVSVVSAWRRERRPTRSLGAVVVLGCFIVFVAGIASWFSPFGWLAWGPRLMVPLVPALMVAAAAGGGEALARLVEGGVRRAGVLVAVGGTLIVIALPQLGLPWTSGSGILTETLPDRVCPGILTTLIQQDRDQFFRCAEDVAWRLQPNQLLAAWAPAPWEAWAARASTSTLCVLMLIITRAAERGGGR